MNRDQKAAVIEEMSGQIRDAEAIFAVDPQGLTVKQAVALRDRLEEVDATIRVVKNSLTERAADRAGVDGLKALLTGPTALTFARGDAATAAKTLSTFRRETQLLPFKGGTLGREALSIDQVESISRLPSRDVLQGQFVGVLASPLSGLVRTLSALISGVVVALGQIQEKGLIGGGDAPAGTEADTPGEADAPASTDATTLTETDDAPATDPNPSEADAPASTETSAETPTTSTPAQGEN